MTAPVKIDIWSDVACPWCYIGKRKFEAGAAASGIPVEIEYHSYELSPDTPVNFEGSAIEFLSGHKGIPVRAGAGDDRPGVRASPRRSVSTTTTRTSTTRRRCSRTSCSHFAKAQGKQLDVTEALFKAYFVDGGHVGHIDELVALAESVGLDGAEARAALDRPPLRRRRADRSRAGGSRTASRACRSS